MSWLQVVVLSVLQGLTEFLPVSSSAHLLILKAWFNGLFVAAHRTFDYWMGWYVIVGTIPIGVSGLLFKDEIRTGARNLWLIASALIVFSVVIAAAEYYGRQTRHVEQLTFKDSIVVGLAQCLARIRL